MRWRRGGLRSREGLKVQQLATLARLRVVAVAEAAPIAVELPAVLVIDVKWGEVATAAMPLLPLNLRATQTHTLTES